METAHSNWNSNYTHPSELFEDDLYQFFHCSWPTFKRHFSLVHAIPRLTQSSVWVTEFPTILMSNYTFNLRSAGLKSEQRVCSQKETGRCGNEIMNERMNEKWTIVQVKCKTEFVLTLKQARGLRGCLGNWLPVRWMGKWAWSQQGFVGRWERRQAIGAQHMPHGGSALIIWQRCWPSSICWEMRRFTTTWHVGSPGTPPLSHATAGNWKQPP